MNLFNQRINTYQIDSYHIVIDNTLACQIVNGFSAPCCFLQIFYSRTTLWYTNPLIHFMSWYTILCITFIYTIYINVIYLLLPSLSSANRTPLLDKSLSISNCTPLGPILILHASTSCQPSYANHQSST